MQWRSQISQDVRIPGMTSRGFLDWKKERV